MHDQVLKDRRVKNRTCAYNLNEFLGSTKLSAINMGVGVQNKRNYVTTVD